MKGGPEESIYLHIYILLNIKTFLEVYLRLHIRAKALLQKATQRMQLLVRLHVVCHN